ncbi:MAG TPA: hypothetical protein HPQ00_04195 [Magnetococcales bacterium]|nr:hypothetical protein [Magnetococcales bacterium]
MNKKFAKISSTALSCNWPPLGTGRFQSTLFILGFVTFAWFMVYLTVAPQMERMFFPIKPDFNMNYLYRAVQMDECYLQNCPAMKDIREQAIEDIRELAIQASLQKEQGMTTGPLTRHEYISGPYLVTYTHLYSFLMYSIKNILSWPWMQIDFVFRIFGTILISVGIAYWLLKIYGPVSAGLALPFLIGLDNFLPEHGLSLVTPGSLSMGTSLLFWGILLHRRGRVGAWLLFMILIQMTLHTVGVGYTLITLGMFLFLQGWPVQRKSVIVIFLGVVLVFLYYALLLNSERPLGFSAHISMISKNQSLASVDSVFQFSDFMGYVNKWTHLFGIGNILALIAISTVLTLSIAKKNIAFPVSLFLHSGLLIVSIFYSYFTEGIFQRYWMVMSVFLTGAFACFLVILLEFVLTATPFMGHFKQDVPSRQSLSFSRKGGITVSIMLAMILLAYSINLDVINEKIGRYPVSVRAQKLVMEKNYPFDPKQPSLLFDEGFPCRKVLYVDEGTPYLNDAPTTLVHTYFIHGAMNCGALLYRMAHNPNNHMGRAYLEKFRSDISHVVFINMTHTGSHPVSLRDGKVQFDFYKEVGSVKWRFMLNNPGQEKAIVSLRGIKDNGPYGAELALFVLQPGWKGWVGTQVPDKVLGESFGLVVKNGRDVRLEGTRLGEEGGRDLLWPWDQGIAMSFTNYIKGPRSLREKMRRTTRFTVSEMVPGFPLEGVVIGDQGYSVLAEIPPPRP